jgi:DNA-binding IclR family transcriptional regulator
MDDTLTMPQDSDETDRQFVNALARGLDILSCFGSDDRFLSNNEIARRTGLARPTVTRLTYTLMKTGHLLRNDTSGEYRLGGKVLQLGFSVLANMSIDNRYGDILEDLADGPNPYITSGIAERVGTRAVYLARHRTRQAVSLSLEVGARLPLFYAGIGRAILAGMKERERDVVFREAVEEFPEQKSRMEESLAKLLEDYATYGYCTSFGSWKPEVNAIAVPFPSLDGSTVYGLNVGAPSFLVSEQELHEEYGPRLLHAAKTLSGK